MPDPVPMTPEEERRCLDALRILNITSPDHPALSHRGYLGLFLNGLASEDFGNSAAHPGAQDFREIVQLLARAGVERLREILSHAEEIDHRPVAPPPVASKPTAPFARAAAGDVRSPILGLDNHRATVGRVIVAERPDAKELERRRHIHIPEDLEKLGREIEALAKQEYYHDAHFLIAEWLLHHGLDEDLLELAGKVIELASHYERSRGLAPFNMLWECEELAQILQRHVPDMSRLSLRADENTARLHRCVRIVYSAWTLHAKALIEYRYRTTDTEYMTRTWLEPGDFGFLLDIAKAGVRSKLPFDLMYFLYQKLKECIAIANHVIAHEHKRAKFEGDVLRMLAGPVKESVPDLAFTIYVDIIQAYMREGDTANATLFCKQALLIRKNDPQVSELLATLSRRHR
jgi:hypothetical protein